MFSRIHIENFRCIKELDVELAPLTVFVGANASGKSAVLDAVATTAASGFIRSQDDRDRNPAIPACVAAWPKSATDPTLRFSQSSLAQIQTLTATMQRYLSDERYIRAHQKALPTHLLLPLRLEIEAIRAPRASQAASAIRRSGENLLNVIETLPRRTQDKLAQELRDLITVLGDVDVAPAPDGSNLRTLRYWDRWNEKLWFPPEEVSDGTILLTAFLTLQYLDPRPEVVTIEEPERGLHPYLLGELVGYLRKLSQGTLGGSGAPIQVLVATHSGDFLDHVQPEEVRFLSRTDDGGVRCDVVDPTTPEWREALRVHDGSLGRIWLSGGLGGLPNLRPRA